MKDDTRTYNCNHCSKTITVSKWEWNNGSFGKTSGHYTSKEIDRLLKNKVAAL